MGHCSIICLEAEPPKHRCPECSGRMEPRSVPKLADGGQKKVINPEIGDYWFRRGRTADQLRQEAGSMGIPYEVFVPAYKQDPQTLWFHI